MCNPATLNNRYLDVLNNRLGWDASVDDDGDVVFQLSDPADIDRAAVWIDNHAPSDPEYLRMHTGIPLVSFDDASDSSLAVLAAKLTRNLKGVKLTVRRSFLVISAEMVVAGPGCMPDGDHLAAILPRVRRMLVGAFVQFYEAMTLQGIEAATRAAEGAED
jgi:hypothetical protein